MIKIVNNTSGSSITDLAYIDNIIFKNQLTQRRNGVYTIDFECVEEELKTKYLQSGNQILYDNNLFDIKYIELNHDVGTIYKVKCDHISYRLLDETIINFAFSGTPTEILTELLDGTDFQVGTIDFTDSIVFNLNRESSVLGLIRLLAETIGGVLKFDILGFNVSIVQPLNNGKQARIRKNISSISKIIDDRETLKTSYSIDLVNIYKSDDLILEGFENFEEITIYDIIKVIDEVQNIDVLQEVVEIKKDIIKDEKVNITIANFIDDFNDDFQTLRTEAIKKREYVYGITIDNDTGFKVERNDKLARSIFNADEFTMQTGNGLGSYTDALSFDPILGKYKFVGDIEASGTITGADFIGGTINIGSGTFTVDSSGNVIANSLTVNNGTITGGSLNGTSGTFSGILTASNLIVASDNTREGSINIDLDGDYFVIDAVVSISGDKNATIGTSVNPSGFIDPLNLFTIASDDTRFSGTLRMNSSEIVATQNWVNSQNFATQSFVTSQGYITSSALVGYATQSYAVQDLSSQNISLQYLSGNNTVEVRVGGVYRGAITLS